MRAHQSQCYSYHQSHIMWALGTLPSPSRPQTRTNWSCKTRQVKDMFLPVPRATGNKSDIYRCPVMRVIITNRVISISVICHPTTSSIQWLNPACADPFALSPAAEVPTRPSTRRAVPPEAQGGCPQQRERTLGGMPEHCWQCQDLAICRAKTIVRAGQSH